MEKKPINKDDFQFDKYVCRAGDSFIICRPETIIDAFVDDGQDFIIFETAYILFNDYSSLKPSVEYNNIEELIGTKVLPMIVIGPDPGVYDEVLLFSYNGEPINVNTLDVDKELQIITDDIPCIKKFPVNMGPDFRLRKLSKSVDKETGAVACALDVELVRLHALTSLDNVGKTTTWYLGDMCINMSFAKI